MPDQYVVVPAHVVRHAIKHVDQFAAADDASRAVEKDKVPRVVLRVMADVRVSALPEVEIVQIAEVGRG